MSKLPSDVSSITSGRTDGTLPEQTKQSAPAPLGRTLALLGVTLGLSTVLTGSIAGPKGNRFPARLLAQKEVVTATTDGTIDELKVKPGQLVTKDQELLILSKPNLCDLTADAEKHIQRLEAELCTAQAKAVVESQRLVDELDQQIFRLEDQIAVMGGDAYLERMRAKAWSEQQTYFSALTSTEIPLTGLAPLTKPLQDSRAEMESIIKEAESENRAETLKARIELCQNRLKIVRDRKEQVLKQYEVAVGVPQIQKQLELAKSHQADLQTKADNETISSPKYGLTGNIPHQVKDVIKAGDVLVEVFDRDHEFVEAHLPARFAGSLKPGDTVQVHFPENVVRDGQVETIPPETSRSDKDESEITVRVLPTGKVWPYLPIGSTVQISVR